MAAIAAPASPNLAATPFNLEKPLEAFSVPCYKPCISLLAFSAFVVIVNLSSPKSINYFHRL